MSILRVTVKEGTGNSKAPWSTELSGPEYLPCCGYDTGCSIGADT